MAGGIDGVGVHDAAVSDPRLPVAGLYPSDVRAAQLLQALERPTLDVAVDLVVAGPAEEEVVVKVPRTRAGVSASPRGPASLRPTMCARLPRLKALPEVSDSRTTGVLHLAHAPAIRP